MKSSSERSSLIEEALCVFFAGMALIGTPPGFRSPAAANRAFRLADAMMDEWRERNGNTTTKS